MKIIVTHKHKFLITTALIMGFLFFLLVNSFGYITQCKYISVLSALSEVNKYEIRNKLLLDAMQAVGVCTPEDAAIVWASGLENRNAAQQYSVMSPRLKKVYVTGLEETAPNWVTGVSSPWVNQFKIIDSKKLNESTYQIELCISTETSDGPYADYTAILTLVKDDSFWHISNIKMDHDLYAYTGFLE